jgi:hypothetical protein
LLGLLAACLVLFLAWHILRPWRWRWHIHPKRWLTFSRLHWIISQKIITLHNHCRENRRSYILTSCPIKPQNLKNPTESPLHSLVISQDFVIKKISVQYWQWSYYLRSCVLPLPL